MHSRFPSSANYIHWRFVKDLGGYTTQQMIDLAFAFSSVLYGTSQPEARYRPLIEPDRNCLERIDIEI